GLHVRGIREYSIAVRKEARCHMCLKGINLIPMVKIDIPEEITKKGRERFWHIEARKSQYSPIKETLIQYAITLYEIRGVNGKSQEHLSKLMIRSIGISRAKTGMSFIW